MRSGLIAIALAVVIVSCSMQNMSDADIVGLWSSQTRTKGGLGSQLTFLSDGKMSHTFGALVDFEYQIEGGHIRTTLLRNGEPTQEVSTQEFLVDDTTLTLNPKSSETKQVMNRIGRLIEDTNPIVGEWTYQHYTGVPAIMRYSSKGIMQLSVPFTTLSGAYSQNDSHITIRLDGQEPTRVTINISGAKMTIMGDDSGDDSQDSFSRFEF